LAQAGKLGQCFGFVFLLYTFACESLNFYRVSYPDFPDEILARLLRTSDEQAFREIYRRYGQRLYGLALRKTGQPDRAEEVVQNLFLTLWDKRETLLIEHLERYLFSSVRHGVIRLARDRFGDMASLDAVSEQTAESRATEERLLLADLRTALDAALTTLPDKTQAVFRLSRFEQLSHTEIAAQLDLTEKAIEYHITLALKQLRVELREFLP
jgi:RNA polymerase sigma-70 factor (family 1)